MVTVICQYSGLEFEAASKRSKNHPRVAILLEDANRKGVYGDVVSAMARAKREGVTGEGVIEAGAVALANGLAAVAEFNMNWRNAQRERLQAESARIAEYRTNGPRTPDSAHDDEDTGEGQFDITRARGTGAESEIFG
jgi:hypothetical protein